MNARSHPSSPTIGIGTTVARRGAPRPASAKDDHVDSRIDPASGARRRGALVPAGALGEPRVRAVSLRRARSLAARGGPALRALRQLGSGPPVGAGATE